MSGIKFLHRELQQLRGKPIDGISVHEDESDMFNVTVSIVGPEGSPYTSGRFVVKLSFCDEYPKIPPKAIFATTIFHPNVSPTSGEICVSTLQKDWRPDYGLSHLLLTIKSLLLTPNAESALNEAAGKLLLADYGEFCRHAALLTSIHCGRRAKRACDESENRDEAANAEAGPTAPPAEAAPSGGAQVGGAARRKLRRV